jgi:hypothetical protein
MRWLSMVKLGIVSGMLRSTVVRDHEFRRMHGRKSELRDRPVSRPQRSGRSFGNRYNSSRASGENRAWSLRGQGSASIAMRGRQQVISAATVECEAGIDGMRQD